MSSQQRAAATLDFQLLFEGAPNPYLVLAPDLSIVAATDAYLRISSRQRDELVGRHIFNAFPDSPANAGSGVHTLRVSLERVLRERVPDTMAILRYDMQHLEAQGGDFERRYWSTVNTPMLDKHGQVAFIIHRVEDVTEFVQLKQQERARQERTEQLETRAEHMEAEMYRRAQEVQIARHEAEAQRARLRSLFMQAPGAISVVHGPDMIYELANAAYRQLVGANRPLDNKPLLEAVPDLDPSLIEILRRVYTTGERFVGAEFPITLDWDYNGQPYTKFMNFVYEPTRAADATIDGIMSFAYDVTDHVAARHKVEESELKLRVALFEAKAAQQRLALLAEASATLTSLLDYETTLQSVANLAVPTLADFCFFDIVTQEGTTERVAWAHADSAKQASFGQTRHFSPSPTVQQHPIVQALASGQTQFRSNINDAFLQQIAISPEHLQFLRDLGFHTLLSVPVIAHSHTIGVLTFGLVDPDRHYADEDCALAEELARRAALSIENVRLYAEEQTARAEAEAAVHMRDEFLSIAAHELKTPVTSLLGYAQLLLGQSNKGQTPNPQRMQRALTVIEQQSLKLAQFIDQLLDVSRIVSGRLQLQRVPVNVGQLVQELAEALQRTTERHTLSVMVTGDTIIDADPLRLEQVAANVINNAIKYSPDGGPVGIEVERLSGATLQISVTDRGIGIPPEHRPHIFDRFYQAHGGQYLGGMGLGLSISLDIVQLHGGTIHAEFPAEGGTRVIITLPTSTGATAVE